MFGMVDTEPGCLLCLQICVYEDFFQGTVHWSVHMAPSVSTLQVMLQWSGRTMAHSTSLFLK